MKMRERISVGFAIALLGVTVFFWYSGWPKWQASSTLFLGLQAGILTPMIVTFAPEEKRLVLVLSLIGTLGCLDIQFRLFSLQSLNPSISDSVLALLWVLSGMTFLFGSVFAYHVFRCLPFRSLRKLQQGKAL